MANPDPNHDRLNTLKLDQRDLCALDSKLSESHPSKGTKADREHTRFEFLKTRIVLEIVHPDGNRVKMPVVSRNLSKQGIALLHSAYVHIGSHCVVWIFNPTSNKWNQVPGEVTRCEHRSGTAHEVGIHFDNEINTQNILNLDPMGGMWTQERVDLVKLRGRMLVLDPDDLVQRLIVGLLKQTEIEVAQATTPEEALEKASGCDLILCEYYLGETTGPEFTTSLRNSGLMTPVLLMTGDKAESIRDEMRCAGAAGFLGKPLTSHTLHRAIAEFMLDSTSSEFGQTAISEDDPRADLLAPFVGSLKDMASKVEKAVESDDHTACLALCRQLAGQAPSFGFEELGRVADEAMSRLSASGNLKESSVELAHLVGLCQQTKAKPLTPKPENDEPKTTNEPPPDNGATDSAATDQAA